MTPLAEEPRDGWIRVELEIDRPTSFPLPLRHGMSGTLDVEVERVSPAVLVLRAVGRLLDASPASAGAAGGGDRT